MKLTLLLLQTLVLTVHSLPKILRTPENSSNVPPCALTCGGGGPTVWKMSRYHRGRAWVTADISKCGFVSPPVVTANIVGKNGNYLPPSVGVTEVSKDRFEAYVLGSNAMSTEVNRRSLQFHWVALGYVC